MNILIASRRLVVGSLSDWDLGVFARKYITDHILPTLQKMWSSGKPERREEIEELIGKYKDYLDPGNIKSGSFGKYLRDVIQKGVERTSLDPGDAEDVEQDVMLRFVKPLGDRDGGSTLWDAMSRFDLLDGPSLFLAYWRKVSFNAVLYAIRTRLHSHRDELPENRSDYMLKTMKAPEPLEEAELVKIVKDLGHYVRRNLKEYPIKLHMFNLWAKSVDYNGSQDMRINRDVLVPVMKEYNLSLGTVRDWWQDVSYFILKFFKDEAQIDDIAGVRRVLHQSRVLHASMEERIASDFYRKQVAMWVLGFV